MLTGVAGRLNQIAPRRTCRGHSATVTALPGTAACSTGACVCRAALAPACARSSEPRGRGVWAGASSPAGWASGIGLSRSGGSVCSRAEDAVCVNGRHAGTLSKHRLSPAPAFPLGGSSSSWDARFQLAYQLELPILIKGSYSSPFPGIALTSPGQACIEVNVP